MKKIFYFFAPFLLASCTDYQHFDVELEPLPSSRLNELRTVDEAETLTNKLLNDVNVCSRGESPKLISKSHVIVDVASRSADPDTLMYAFDFANDGGFILISASKNIEPILAIVDDGSYEDATNGDNPAFTTALNNITQNARKIINPGGTIPDKPIIEIIDTTKAPLVPMFYYDTIDVNERINPCVEVAWGGEVDAAYCENKITGCVPTAIAQAFSVFENPTYINYTFAGKDISSETLNWKEIKKHKRSSLFGNFCYNCNSSASHKPVARLMRQIGEDAHTNYENKGYSSTTSFDCVKTIIQSYASKSPVRTGSSISHLFSYLGSSGDFAIVRSGRIDDYEYGHVFIADGKININYYVARYEYSSKGYVLTDKYNEKKSTLLHYNWGWAGNCNGWFSIYALNPNVSDSYDYDFLNSNKYEYNIDDISYYLYKK